MRKYRVLIAAWSLALVGCTGQITKSTDMVFDASVGAPGGGSDLVLETSFTQVQTQLLTPSCALSGCHGGTVFPHLSAGSAYANLVNAPSSAGFRQVSPGDPGASYLLTKITGGEGMRGGRMPPGGTPLDSVRIALVRAWIADGAAQD